MTLKILGALCALLACSCLSQMPLVRETLEKETRYVSGQCGQSGIVSEESKMADSLLAAIAVNKTAGARTQNFCDLDRAKVLYRLSVVKSELEADQKVIAALEAAVDEDRKELEKYSSLLKQLSEMRK